MEARQQRDRAHVALMYLETSSVAYAELECTDR